MVNIIVETTPNQLIDNGKWDNYCLKHGWDVYSVAEGYLDGDKKIKIPIEEYKEL